MPKSVFEEIAVQIRQKNDGKLTIHTADHAVDHGSTKRILEIPWQIAKRIAALLTHPNEHCHSATIDVCNACLEAGHRDFASDGLGSNNIIYVSSASGELVTRQNKDGFQNPRDIIHTKVAPIITAGELTTTPNYYALQLSRPSDPWWEMINNFEIMDAAHHTNIAWSIRSNLHELTMYGNAIAHAQASPFDSKRILEEILVEEPIVSEPDTFRLHENIQNLRPSILKKLIEALYERLGVHSEDFTGKFQGEEGQRKLAYFLASIAWARRIEDAEMKKDLHCLHQAKSEHNLPQKLIQKLFPESK